RYVSAGVKISYNRQRCITVNPARWVYCWRASRETTGIYAMSCSGRTGRTRLCGVRVFGVCRGLLRRCRVVIAGVGDAVFVGVDDDLHAVAQAELGQD